MPCSGGVVDGILQIRDKYSNTKQVAEEIYLTLREAIITNILHAGDRLQEEKLSALFGVSRTPAREAVKRLEFEGLVSFDMKYGFHVRGYSPEECIELMESLEYLRQITTRIAAENISRANLIRLSDNIARTREGDGDLVGLFEEFHRIIAESVNNAPLHACYTDIASKYACVINRHQRRVFNPDAVEDHARIYEALAARDKETAWSLSVEHSEKTSVRIRQFLL